MIKKKVLLALGLVSTLSLASCSSGKVTNSINRTIDDVRKDTNQMETMYDSGVVNPMNYNTYDNINTYEKTYTTDGNVDVNTYDPFWQEVTVSPTNKNTNLNTTTRNNITNKSTERIYDVAEIQYR